MHTHAHAHTGKVNAILSWIIQLVDTVLLLWSQPLNNRNENIILIVCSFFSLIVVTCLAVPVIFQEQFADASWVDFFRRDFPFAMATCSMFAGASMATAPAIINIFSWAYHVESWCGFSSMSWESLTAILGGKKESTQNMQSRIMRALDQEEQTVRLQLILKADYNRFRERILISKTRKESLALKYFWSVQTFEEQPLYLRQAIAFLCHLPASFVSVKYRSCVPESRHVPLQHKHDTIGNQSCSSSSSVVSFGVYSWSSSSSSSSEYGALPGPCVALCFFISLFAQKECVWMSHINICFVQRCVCVSARPRAQVIVCGL